MTRAVSSLALGLCTAVLCTACVRSSSRSAPASTGPPAHHPPGGLPAAVRHDLALVGSALGSGYELARYGMPNPACWTAQNAPVKVKRRLTGAIESGAGWDTQLCMAEYVRRGTHEDLLFKIYVLSDPTMPNRIIGAPYFQRKASQLQAGDYPRMETAPRLLFYITGSPSNAPTAVQVMPQWSARLRSVTSGRR